MFALLIVKNLALEEIIIKSVNFMFVQPLMYWTSQK